MNKNKKGFKLPGHTLPGVNQRSNTNLNDGRPGSSAFQHNINPHPYPSDHAHDDPDTGGDDNVVNWEPYVQVTPWKPSNRPPNTSPLGGQNLPGNGGWWQNINNIFGQGGSFGSFGGGTGWNPYPPGGFGGPIDGDGDGTPGGNYIDSSMFGSIFGSGGSGGFGGGIINPFGGGSIGGGNTMWQDLLGQINFTDMNNAINNYGSGTPQPIGGPGGGPPPTPNPTNYGGAGSACFIPETLITMADGSEKKIEDIELGDVVKSEIGESTVEGIDIHIRKETVYSINDSGHFVTANHPFKTTEGWKAIDPKGSMKDHGVEADRLIVGDTILTLDGEERATTIEAGNDVTKVYNLRLDNEHVYYANGYLVHNEKNVGDGSLGDPRSGKPVNEGRPKRKTPMRNYKKGYYGA